MTLKNEIQSLILDKTCNGPCTVQFSAELTLFKRATVVLDQSVQQPEDERVEMFANSMMTPLYANGLSDELFLEMLGKIEAVFQNFSAHDSGWVLQRVNELYIIIGKMLPIRGSSFIPLPVKIANSQQLINIRNHIDHNCFLLCYTAAYHLKYKPDIIFGRLVDPKLEETYPHTYTKPGTHQASDDFVMPLSLNMIPQFEQLKNVHVNVFQNQKGDLISRISDQSVQQPEDQRVEIFANSMMTPLNANGLTDEIFLGILGKIDAVFQNFSAHGSGWVTQRVNELYIIIGKM